MPVSTDTKPFKGIVELGLTELVDKDDTEVSASDYTDSVAMYTDTSGDGTGDTTSGYIVGVSLVSLELGSGGVRTPAGVLYIFDADPAVSAGDTALATGGAEHKTLIGTVAIASGDWASDANGGIAYRDDIRIPYHALGTIYVAFRTASGSTAINDAAGDDEEIWINMWVERWS